MNAVAPHLAVAAEAAAPDMVAAAIAGACRRIAPLWPLQRFVAVNPSWDSPSGPSTRPARRCAG